MRHLYSKKAFTLMEIIIASTIVAVIILGVVTSSISLQRASKNSSNSYFAAQSTQTLLNYFLEDAYKAVGTISSKGILIGTAETGDANTTCFYQQNVGVPLAEFRSNGLPVTTPAATAPQWVCYTYPLVGESTGNVYSCTKNVTSAAPGSCLTETNKKLVGRAKDVTPLFEVVPDQLGGQKVLFHVQISNCLKVGAGITCGSGDADNPYVVKEGSVSPPAHSASPITIN